MLIFPLRLSDCIQLPSRPCPHQTAPTLPWAEGLFQLRFEPRSDRAAQLRRLCVMSSPTLLYAVHKPCVGAAKIVHTLYNDKYTAFFCRAPQRRATVFLAARCGIDASMEAQCIEVFLCDAALLSRRNSHLPLMGPKNIYLLICINILCYKLYL